MAREKYVELRKKRLKERDERLKRQRERIRAQRERARPERLKKWIELVARRRKRIEEQLEKARLEKERRKKVRDAIESAKTAVREVEKETEASVYVPEITTEISKMLADADDSFRSTDYEKAMTLSFEIKELVEKARLEASKRVEERKRAEEEERKRRFEEQFLLEKRLEEEKREKAREAIGRMRTAVEEAEDKTKLSLYVPEITNKINEMLTDAEKSFDLADYEKAVKFSFEIEELVEKARLEASRKAEEKLEQEKTREAIRSVRMAVEEVEEKTKASLYVPEITKKINEMLTDADKSFDLAHYEKAIKLSFEIEKLVEKARLDASRKAEEKRKRRKEEAKYFYCVIPFSKEKSFGNIGMNNGEVYTIPYRDVAVVVSDSPMKDYELTEDNTKRHGAVLRQIMKEHTVVPVEFGTTLKNERILRRSLTKAYDPTRKCLKLVDNMVELGVKAVLNEDIVYVDHAKRKECISDILVSLNTKAKQTVTGDLFSDRLILNASYLVDKDDMDAFSEEVERLREKYSMLKLLYSGPWAPYNFVYIKIGAEGIEVTK